MWTFVSCVQGYTNPGRLIAWDTTFYTVAPNTLDADTAVFFLPFKNVYQRALRRSEVYRSLQSYGFSVWNLLRVTLVAP